MASLPPSSRDTGVSVCAAWAIRVLPAGTLPVKNSLSMPFSKKAVATLEPEPTMCWNRPSGSSPASRMRSMARPTAGVAAATLSSTALPAISAMTISPNGIDSG